MNVVEKKDDEEEVSICWLSNYILFLVLVDMILKDKTQKF